MTETKSKVKLDISTGMTLLVGVMAAALVLVLVGFPFYLIVHKGWAWFSVEPSLVRPVGPGGLYTGVFKACVALIAVSLVVRTARGMRAQGPAALGTLLSDVLGLGFWYLYAHTGFGAAGYFISDWILNLGSALAVLWALMSFVGGWAPGFLGGYSLFLYLVYHDARLLTWLLLPGLVGDVLEAFLRDQSGKKKDEG